MAGKKGRDRRSRLQREQDRCLSANGNSDHFYYLHTNQDEVAALHAPGFSSPCSAACAALAASGAFPSADGDSKPSLLVRNNRRWHCLHLDCHSFRRLATTAAVFQSIFAFHLASRL